MDFSQIERTTILAFYYIDKVNNVDKFTNRFNQYYKRDVSSATILFDLSRIKKVDPANNIQSETDQEYSFLWKYYISDDKIKELKAFYSSFKRGDYIYKADNLTDDDEKISFVKRDSHLPKDEPVAPPEDYKRGIKAYRRHRDVVLNALALAGYMCEAGCKSELFYRKDGSAYYTEAHHIIPLCYQKDFEYSLDTEANIISLCPRCHRLVHYGRNYEKLLRIIYEKRANRLEKCGIGVSFEQLLLIYR